MFIVWLQSDMLLVIATCMLKSYKISSICYGKLNLRYVVAIILFECVPHCITPSAEVCTSGRLGVGPHC